MAFWLGLTPLCGGFTVIDVSHGNRLVHSPRVLIVVVLVPSSYLLSRLRFCAHFLLAILLRRHDGGQFGRVTPTYCKTSVNPAMIFFHLSMLLYSTSYLYDTWLGVVTAPFVYRVCGGWGYVNIQQRKPELRACG